MKKTYISNSKITFAMILSDIENPKLGCNFFSEEKWLIQGGLMSYPTNYKIQAHFHKPEKRVTIGTQEVIFMIDGILRCDFFDASNEKVTECILNKGDICFLLDGTHGFEVLEDATFLEFKNGPYLHVNDKIRI